MRERITEFVMPRHRNIHPNAYRSRDIIMARRERRYEQAERDRQNFLELHRFVQMVIGPWATQARISQLIAEDFDEMELDRNVRAAAEKVSFGKYNTVGNSPQVGHARFVQIAPSRVKPQNHRGGQGNNVIHRGVTEQEFFRGEPAVRLYVTIFKEVQVPQNGITPFKDIQQNQQTGLVSIYTGNQEEPILWVNAGQPLRALKWLEKYKVEKDASGISRGGRPVIRSFCLPTKDYLRITLGAILEHDAGLPRNSKASFNVDRHYASDQFGIRGDALKLLKENVIPFSLVTYVAEPGYARPAVSGQIFSVQVLRDRLGVPAENIDGVWVDDSKGEFVKKDKFKDTADKLMNIYGTWFGNQQFITPQWTSIPHARRSHLMRDYLSDYKLFIADEYWQKIAKGAVPSVLAAQLLR
jgi:hypothetical protein